MKTFHFLHQRKERGELQDIDIFFAEFMAELASTNDAQLINIFAELSHAQGKQHSCLDLTNRVEIIEKLKLLPSITILNPPNIKTHVSANPLVLSAVSYTHLTLPTIYSV